MGFWRSLVSADGQVSSKRFAGICLIGSFMAILILAAIGGNCPAEVESLAKVGLYTGASLLGASVVPEMIKIVQRPVPIVIERKEDEDK